MPAIYDLSRAPPTYDFLTWLVRAAMTWRKLQYGRLKVRIEPGPNEGFRNDGLPPDLPMRRQMLETVVRAAIPRIGADESDAGPRLEPHGYMLHLVVAAARRGEAVPRFRASARARESLEPLDRPYATITLRECPYWPERNSNIAAWQTAVERLHDRGYQAIVVPDANHPTRRLAGAPSMPQAATDMDLRLALYERAALNLGVNNGPMHLLYFSDSPYIVMNQLSGGPCCNAAHWSQNAALEPGTQMPWAGERQRMTWTPDTPENVDGEIARSWL